VFETTAIAEELHKREGGKAVGNAISGLLNVIKNKRRVKLAQILLERPLSIDEIQQRLKMEGYYHSRDTIRKHYAGPLVAMKLIVEEDGKYRLTDEGRGIIAILGDIDLGSIFPASSGCYEENCLLALEVPKSYNDLAHYLPKADLQRTIRRLQGKGLVAKAHPSRHVTYRRTRGGSNATLSKTENKVLESIPEEGMGVTDIAMSVGISLRRTFKYLKRLREKGLVSNVPNVTLLSLTEEGKRLAEKLRQILSIMPKTDIPQPIVEEYQKGGQKGEEGPEARAPVHSGRTQSALIAPNRANGAERAGRFTTKRDLRERQLYGLVLDAGDAGIVQSDLSTMLSLPNREISRICSRLESWGLIRKDEVVHEGRRTFRIESTRKPPSLNSILGSPCITCPNMKMCEENNELEPMPYKASSPQECQQLERWIRDYEISSPIDSTARMDQKS
jgi:predicted transcriptional regulator